MNFSILLPSAESSKKGFGQLHTKYWLTTCFKLAQEKVW